MFEVLSKFEVISIGVYGAQELIHVSGVLLLVSLNFEWLGLLSLESFLTLLQFFLHNYSILNSRCKIIHDFSVLFIEKIGDSLLKIIDCGL